jgi:hypothetical protein
MTFTRHAVVCTAIFASAACGSPSPGSDAAHDASMGDVVVDSADTAMDSTVDGSPDATVTVDAMTDAPTPTDAPSPLAGGTIVPLYTDPSDATWSQLATAARAHPTVSVVAVINPNNGPTASADPSYAAGITMLASAGITVIGYVATGYGSRPIADIDHDIDLYQSQYSSLSGIFFDEAATYETGHETLYGMASSHARSAGYRFLVANPGTAPIDAYASLFDVQLVYESAGLPSESSLHQFAAQRSHCGIIPYAVPTFDATAASALRPDVEYMYITNDTLPNPWDTLPTYFDSLLTALE